MMLAVPEKGAKKRQRRGYRGQQTGRFSETDRRVCDYVNEKRNEGMLITRAVMQQKTLGSGHRAQHSHALNSKSTWAGAEE